MWVGLRVGSGHGVVARGGGCGWLHEGGRGRGCSGVVDVGHGGGVIDH